MISNTLMGLVIIGGLLIVVITAIFYYARKENKGRKNTLNIESSDNIGSSDQPDQQSPQRSQKCPSCSFEVSNTAKFCKKCGLKL